MPWVNGADQKAHEIRTAHLFKGGQSSFHDSFLT